MSQVKRIYRIALTSPTDPSDVKTYTVNLTYTLDGDNAVDQNGRTVDREGITATLEAVNRLRRLAAKEKVQLSETDLEERDWDITLMRERLIA